MAEAETYMQEPYKQFTVKPCLPGLTRSLFWEVWPTSQGTLSVQISYVWNLNLWKNLFSLRSTYHCLDSLKSPLNQREWHTRHTVLGMPCFSLLPFFFLFHASNCYSKIMFIHSTELCLMVVTQLPPTTSYMLLQSAYSAAQSISHSPAWHVFCFPNAAPISYWYSH